MDIFNEIDNLPNFGYLYDGDDGKPHLAILGTRDCEVEETYTYYRKIEDTLDKMKELYSHTPLSEDDKIQLARLMIRMRDSCRMRKIGLYTRGEQRQYISNLSTAEKEQIEQQIKMYKDCRLFHSDYKNRL